MGRKRHTPEQIITALRLGAGQSSRPSRLRHGMATPVDLVRVQTLHVGGPLVWAPFQIAYVTSENSRKTRI